MTKFSCFFIEHSTAIAYQHLRIYRYSPMAICQTKLFGMESDTMPEAHFRAPATVAVATGQASGGHRAADARRSLLPSPCSRRSAARRGGGTDRPRRPAARSSALVRSQVQARRLAPSRRAYKRVTRGRFTGQVFQIPTNPICHAVFPPLASPPAPSGR